MVGGFMAVYGFDDNKSLIEVISKDNFIEIVARVTILEDSTSSNTINFPEDIELLTNAYPIFYHVPGDTSWGNYYQFNFLRHGFFLSAYEAVDREMSIECRVVLMKIPS